MQNIDDLYAKSCIVADVYDESTLNNIFIEGVDLSIRHSPREYWATHLQASMTGIVLEDQSLLEIQGGATKPANTNNRAASNKTCGKHSSN